MPDRQPKYTTLDAISRANKTLQIMHHGHLYSSHLIFPTLFDGLLYSFVVFSSVLFVEVAGFDICGGTRVRVIEETLYASEDGGNIVCRAPSVLQDIETQFSGTVYVWMEHG